MTLRSTTVAVIFSIALTATAQVSDLSCKESFILERVDNIDLIGRVSLLVFVYADCPGPCERTMEALSKIKSLLETSPGAIQYITILLDRKPIEGESLNRYKSAFANVDSSWIFLQLDRNQLLPIQRRLAELAPPVDGTFYMNSQIFVFGCDGALRGAFKCFRDEDRSTVVETVSQLAAL
jgi:cytochrome oxidase Cu insertion factor (SCO1/SenC/PrrC family)